MDPPPPYTPLPGDSETSPNPLQYQPPPPTPPRPPLQPPQLPPRSPYNQSLQVSAGSSQKCHARSASQVSLVPAVDATKRKLLVIYIHGFMGNETSFQSFPAHLHNLLCVTLEPLGYLVHTKVYPKFKTRYNILVATENFSQWLSQFENDNTDVVLLGHSMGGLLAADVALLQDYTGRKRHRLLGTISFDTPFLGMHPGVISAGLGSIFRPAPKSPGEDSGGPYQDGGEGSSQSNLSLSTINSGGSQVDEFYSKKPSRNFTVVVPKQEGTWGSALHFINKHHSRLTQATGQYLMSHLEFGGCLADPMGLKNRYTTIRALEDGIVNYSGRVDRVRFVNYYTSSTGRTKEATEPRPAPAVAGPGLDEGLHTPGIELEHDLVGVGEGSSNHYGDVGLGASDRVSALEHKRSASASSYNTASSMGDMKHIPADPLTDDDGYEGEPVALHIVETDEMSVADGRPPAGLSDYEKISFEGTIDEKGSSSNPSINIAHRAGYTDSVNEKITLTPEGPVLPPPPEEPPTFDYSQIPDAAVRKAAEKEAARVRKKYEKAVKDYEKAIRDREKELEKMKKNKGKEVDRGIREEEKRKEREEREMRRKQREREKEEDRVEREKLREMRELEKEKDREEREMEREREENEVEYSEKEKPGEMEEWEREREREEREIEKEIERKEREIEREIERREWEITREIGKKERDIAREREKRERDIIKEREKRERDIAKEREKKERDLQREQEKRERKLQKDRMKSQGKEENTQEKQELERLRKEQERMDAEYRRMNGIPEPPPLSPRQAPPSSASSSRSHLPIPPTAPRSVPSTPPKQKQKKKRERRFCILPSDKNDKCWVKVEMTGVDEVGAHCGLFFVGEVYERLVGDVAARIEDWVGEEGSRRVLEEGG